MLCSKILVAHDGSNLGNQALQKAIELAEWNKQIEIEVLHVVNFPIMLEDYAGIHYPEIMEMAMEQGKEIIRNAGEVLSTIPNKWSSSVIEGNPAEAIIDHAKQNNCDLIVMGSRGLSGLKELFLGSVSHNVVQKAPVPVLIVK